MISDRPSALTDRGPAGAPVQEAPRPRDLRRISAIATGVLFALFTLEEWVWGTARVDTAITRVLEHPDTRLLDRLSNVFSLLGSPEVTALAAIAICWLLYRRKGGRAAVSVAAAFVLVLAVEGVLKLVLHHPDVPNPLSPPNAPLPANSFPSGHVLRACVIATGTLLLVPRRAARVAALLFIAVLAYTRIYSGMHWTSDVVAALLLGWSAHVATTRVVSSRRPHAARSPHPCLQPSTPTVVPPSLQAPSSAECLVVPPSLQAPREPSTADPVAVPLPCREGGQGVR